jgi:hypothetical protein
MDRLDELERATMDLIRGAGRYGVYLTHVGFEVAGVADWLESKVPRVGQAIRAMAEAARRELSGALPSAPKDEDR